MPVLLIATYDLGHQPFGLASAAAALDAAGVPATCVDLSRESLPEAAVRAADLVAFFLPMHTATRLALPVIDRVRAVNPHATLCAYGLYAPLNDAILRERGVTEIIGGEFEDDLSALARRDVGTPRVSQCPRGPTLPECARGPTPERLPLARSRSRRLKAAARSRPAASAFAEAPADKSRLARAAGAARGTSHVARPARPALHVVPRVRFFVPLRESLPPLERYASLQWGSERRIVGYTEASRGCKHRCRHCPIVPVYDGRFRVVPRDIVIEDIRRQVGAGAQHITFGDPDFFNGPRHAIDIVRELAAECPGVTYDVTIKVEHLLAHAALLPELAATGCAFVTSAVESIDDRVLELLDKRHTVADFEAAVGLCRSAGVTLSPTFVAFTPWTSVEGYCALLQAIDRLDLIDQVAPIQLAIRLLIPERSRLLELEEVRAFVGLFDRQDLTYRWAHRDPRVDALQETVAGIVGRRAAAPRREVFAEIWSAAHGAAGLETVLREDRNLLSRAAVPYLNEPWYC